MRIELRKQNDDIKVGDAVVFKNGEVRIIVETNRGYGAYAPEEDKVYYDSSKTITDLMRCYVKDNISRIIKRRNLKIVEI